MDLSAVLSTLAGAVIGADSSTFTQWIQMKRSVAQEKVRLDSEESRFKYQLSSEERRFAEQLIWSKREKLLNLKWELYADFLQLTDVPVWTLKVFGDLDYQLAPNWKAAIPRFTMELSNDVDRINNKIALLDVQEIASLARSLQFKLFNSKSLILASEKLSFPERQKICAEPSNIWISIQQKMRDDLSR